MDISPALMKWLLIQTVDSKDQASVVSTLLDQLRKINGVKLACEKSKQVAEETYKKTLQEISDRDYMNQQICPHPTHTHHKDASGNNDSFNKCDLCCYIW